MKIKKCIITAGGYGTRMLPITKAYGKEMLNIVNLPAIFYQVKEAYLSGIKEIIFTTREDNQKLIKDFFTPNEQLMELIRNDENKLKQLEELNEIINNMKFHYVIEKEKGTYGAIYAAKDLLKDEYFAVMYCDDIIDNKKPFLKELIKECEKTDDLVIGVKKYEYEKLPKFGIIKAKKDNIIEKLQYKKDIQSSGLLVHGRFILHTDIFKVKDKLTHYNGELNLPSSLFFTNRVIRYVEFSSQYFNIGDKLDLIKANIYFALKNNELKDELNNYLVDIIKCNN